jgi:hypothetical protein
MTSARFGSTSRRRSSALPRRAAAWVAVKLEAGVVEDKVHAAALLGSAELLRRDVLPNLAEVIT